MQAASEKYLVPEVPLFAQFGRAGLASVASSFNPSHDMSTHSSPSSRAHFQQEQSPTADQHHLQQHLQPLARPSEHQAQRHLAQQKPALPAAQRQQQIPQKSQAHNSQNESPNQEVKVVQPLPAGYDALTTPPKARDERINDLGAAASKSLAVEVNDSLVDDAERGCCGSRWPRDETLALLKLRSEMDSIFRDTNLKGPLWEELSRKLEKMGYHRSAKKCKEKFENVQKYYKRTKDGKAGRHDGKTYRFFSQLEALHGSTAGDATGIEAMPRETPQNERPVAAPLEAIPVSSHGDHDMGLPLPTPKGDEMLRSKDIPVSRHESDCSSGLNVSTESSDDEYESDTLDNRKRRRRSPSRLFLCFFKNLVTEMLNKQEQMQKSLLDTLERRESERMIREEAWKRQEMARLARDQEQRAQERSMAARMDAALLAFLQRMTGQTLEFPSASASIAMLGGGATHRQLGSEMAVKLRGADELQMLETDPNSKRWPKPEVQLLIKLRSELQPKFLDSGAKGMLWKEVSEAMAKMGFTRSAKRCKEKWENINKYFKKAKLSNRKRPENAKTCPYFQELDSLYRNGVLKSLPLTSTEQLSSPYTKLANGHLPSHQARNDQSNGSAQEIIGNAAAVAAAACAPSMAVGAATIDISSVAPSQDVTPVDKFNGGKAFTMSSDNRTLAGTRSPDQPMSFHTHTAHDEVAVKEENTQQQPPSIDQQSPLAKITDEENMDVTEDDTINQTQSSSSIDGSSL